MELLLRILKSRKFLGCIQKARILNHGSDPQKFIAQTQASPPDVVLVDIRGENKFSLVA